MIGIMSGEMFAHLSSLAQRTRNLAAGEFLFRRDDPVRSLFLVEEGEVHLVRFQANGGQLVLQRALSHQAVAEASVFSSAYHCDAVAVVPSLIIEIDRSRFRAELLGNEQLAEAWNNYLAREVQMTRLRAEILSIKTVSSRLDAWLSFHSSQFPEKGEWKILATQIGVTPEALYRELAKRSKAPTSRHPAPAKIRQLPGTTISARGAAE
jgi:CRP-like cAMP-binding protein